MFQPTNDRVHHAVHDACDSNRRSLHRAWKLLEHLLPPESEERKRSDDADRAGEENEQR